MGRSSLRKLGSTATYIAGVPTLLFILLFPTTWVMAWPIYLASARVNGIEVAWAYPVVVLASELFVIMACIFGTLQGVRTTSMVLPLAGLFVLSGAIASYVHAASANNGWQTVLVAFVVTTVLPLGFGGMVALNGLIWRSMRARVADERRVFSRSRPAM